MPLIPAPADTDEVDRLREVPRLVTHQAPRPRLVVRMSSIWSATRRAASGLPSAALAAAMAARRARSPSSSATRRASSAPLELGVVHQERGAAGDHLPRVLALVVGGGVRVRHQDRRLAEGGELGDGAARARHDQIGRRHGGGQAVSVGHQAIALKPLAALLQLAAHLVGVARPADVHELEVELLAAEGVDAGAVDALRALAAAEGEHHGQVRPQRRRPPCPARASRRAARAQRPPRDDVAGRLQPLDGEAQAEALDERPEQPVGDAQVRVGLERQAGDPARAPPRPRPGRWRSRRRRRPRPAGSP